LELPNRPKKGSRHPWTLPQISDKLLGLLSVGRFYREADIMYAIIVDGGRQYKVEQGQRVLLDYRNASAGDTLQFDQVLCARDDNGLKLGSPLLSGATVSGEVVGTRQGEKIFVQKLRRRKTLRRRTGHRQLYTEVQINKIDL
jgi:large subunit ribosomal protein L21